MKNELLKSNTTVCPSCEDIGITSVYLGTGQFKAKACPICKFGTYISDDDSKIYNEINNELTKLKRDLTNYFRELP